jgi:hypothetical protein
VQPDPTKLPEYRILKEAQLLQELIHRGLHNRTRIKHEAKTTTSGNDPIKKARQSELLSIIRERNNVEIMLRLAGYPAGIHVASKHRILSLQSPTTPAPVKGEYTLHETIMLSMLPGNQYAHMKSVMKIMYEIWEAGPPFGPLQCIIMGGLVQQGKSLFVEEIMGGMFDGFADMTVHFGAEQDIRFNEETLPKGVIALDDPPYKDAVIRLTNRIRKFVASPMRRIEIKNGAAINIPLFQALTITTNLEEHNFNVLPAIGGDVADKINVYKTEKATLPEGTGWQLRQQIRIQLDKERPAWLYHLKHEWQIPAEYIKSDKRYDIKSYHNQELLDENPAARKMEEFIDGLNLFVQEREKKTFVGTSYQLKAETENSGHRAIQEWSKRHGFYSTSLGKMLSKAAEIIPDQITIERNTHNNANIYTISAPGPQKIVGFAPEAVSAATPR